MREERLPTYTDNQRITKHGRIWSGNRLEKGGLFRSIEQVGFRFEKSGLVRF